MCDQRTAKERNYKGMKGNDSGGEKKDKGK